MYIRHLTVADFRSWTAADLHLEPGPVLLVGPNGQGKTNLVEALGYLATLGSHRVPTDAPLVRAGAERAVVRAAVVSDGRELRAEIEITPGRVNRGRLNGASVRPRELLGAIRAVIFAPEDLAIVRGDPAERRRFVDDLLVARAPRLAAVRADYDRVLKQRGALLKSAGATRRGVGLPDVSTLDVWDGHLAKQGAQLIAARLAALDALSPHVTSAYTHVAPTSPALHLRYVSSLTSGLPPRPDVDVLESTLLADLALLRSKELERGVNLVGPHRDDLDLRLGELPVRGYASHGESWSTALALRLGCYDLLREDVTTGGAPVLILDDVFAELDTGRRDQLATVAAKTEQAIITAAVPSDVPRELHGVRFDVGDGEVRRVS